MFCYGFENSELTVRPLVLVHSELQCFILFLPSHIGCLLFYFRILKMIAHFENSQEKRVHSNKLTVINEENMSYPHATMTTIPSRPNVFWTVQIRTLEIFPSTDHCLSFYFLSHILRFKARLNDSDVHSGTMQTLPYLYLKTSHTVLGAGPCVSRLLRVFEHLKA